MTDYNKSIEIDESKKNQIYGNKLEDSFGIKFYQKEDLLMFFLPKNKNTYDFKKDLYSELNLDINLENKNLRYQNKTCKCISSDKFSFTQNSLSKSFYIGFENHCDLEKVLFNIQEKHQISELTEEDFSQYFR